MSRTLRQVAAFLSFAAVVVPGIVIALATLSAIESSLYSPSFAGDYAFAYIAWWLGLAAAFALPGLLAKPNRTLLLAAAAGALLVGLASCVWLEWGSLTEPKRVVPVGLFAVPFVAAVLTAVLSKNAG
jgi:hypothetical protein